MDTGFQVLSQWCHILKAIAVRPPTRTIMLSSLEEPPKQWRRTERCVGPDAFTAVSSECSLAVRQA